MIEICDRDPDPAHAMSRGDAWEDLQLKWVGSRPRYDGITDGALVYVPVRKSDVVIGYLWASEDGKAANFLNIESVGVESINAKGAWIRRLLEAKERGLTSVQALEAWIGSPEDERAGCIPEDASRVRLGGLQELMDIANA
ncbi:hypothetical protein [Nocardiopsis sp. CNR-923]|uniref:hypothetical protein n=1 Tax=Nocardiopsis sp. CNR-923 TaxID=1904965 RepID=UPI00117DE73A|nr:hypothetical protein [Nocardiopsis sp. CNR-923]